MCVLEVNDSSQNAGKQNPWTQERSKERRKEERRVMEREDSGQRDRRRGLGVKFEILAARNISCGHAKGIDIIAEYKDRKTDR